MLKCYSFENIKFTPPMESFQQIQRTHYKIESPSMHKTVNFSLSIRRYSENWMWNNFKRKFFVCTQDAPRDVPCGKLLSAFFPRIPSKINWEVAQKYMIKNQLGSSSRIWTLDAYKNENKKIKFLWFFTCFLFQISVFFSLSRKSFRVLSSIVKMIVFRSTL